MEPESFTPQVTVVRDGAVWRIVVHHSARWTERSGAFESEELARHVAASLAKDLEQRTTQEDERCLTP